MENWRTHLQLLRGKAVLRGLLHWRKDIPDNLLMISVPSGINSHKPPLNDLLNSVIDTRFPAWDKVKKMEIFGRNFQPDWRTIRNLPCLMN